MDVLVTEYRTLMPGEILLLRTQYILSNWPLTARHLHQGAQGYPTHWVTLSVNKDFRLGGIKPSLYIVGFVFRRSGLTLGHVKLLEVEF
jgi:hypothetical protein